MKPNRKSMQKEIPFFGTMQVTEKHVVSLRCDRGSSYKAYLAVQNELVAAYNELREELSQEKFGRKIMPLWMKINKKQFVKFILRRFLRQNLKSTEKRSNGKI